MDITHWHNNCTIGSLCVGASYNRIGSGFSTWAMSWTEVAEKALRNSVYWVNLYFPKAEILNSLGGKWKVVAAKMANDGFNFSPEKCKRRFLKIRCAWDNL